LRVQWNNLDIYTLLIAGFVSRFLNLFKLLHLRILG